MRVAGPQLDHAIALVKLLAGEVAIDLGHHNVAVLGRQRPVDHHQRPVGYAQLDRGQTAYFPDESGRRVRDQLFIEVVPLDGKIGSW